MRMLIHRKNSNKFKEDKIDKLKIYYSNLNCKTKVEITEIVLNIFESLVATYDISSKVSTISLM